MPPGLVNWVRSSRGWAYHTRIVPSAPAVTTWLPSVLNCAVLTAPALPLSTVSGSLVGDPDECRPARVPGHDSFPSWLNAAVSGAESPTNWATVLPVVTL